MAAFRQRITWNEGRLRHRGAADHIRLRHGGAKISADPHLRRQSGEPGGKRLRPVPAAVPHKNGAVGPHRQMRPDQGGGHGTRPDHQQNPCILPGEKIRTQSRICGGLPCGNGRAVDDGHRRAAVSAEQNEAALHGRARRRCARIVRKHRDGLDAQHPAREPGGPDQQIAGAGRKMHVLDRRFGQPVGGAHRLHKRWPCKHPVDLFGPNQLHFHLPALLP